MKKLVLTLLAVSLFSSAFGKTTLKESSVVNSAINYDNSVKLDWAQSGTVEVKMYTARGQMVKSLSRISIVAGTSTSLSLQDLASGMYYVTINTGRAVQKIAFVK